MRILLIEDDRATAEAIETILKSKGFSMCVSDRGEEGIDLARVYDYDVILLNLDLPDLGGYQVLRTLRNNKIGTPIIIVDGATQIETKVKCLNGGADDYVTKPFHKDELIARINAVARRSRGHAQSTITVGGITVNLDSKKVEVQGVPVPLTSREYQFLEFFALRRGVMLTKEMILDHIYGGRDEPEPEIVPAFVSKLRKKLGAANDGKHCFEHVWGSGYIWGEPTETASPRLAA